MNITETTKTTNRCSIIGTVVSTFQFDHEILGEKFYAFSVETKRLSGNVDIIKVTASENALAGKNFHEGQRVALVGHIRTYNKVEDNRRSLSVTMFALDCNCCNGEKDKDEVMLKGFICKSPIYRQTPFGREIGDIILAVNRSCNKADYIPVILWGRNARLAKTLKVGDEMVVHGRLQSREYQKKDMNGNLIKKIAYEISASRLEKNA